jgi:S1-C subfamily serine protease
MYNVENWKKGEIRTIFEKTLVPNYYNITWLNDYKKQEISQIIELKSGAIASFGKYTMIKLYPGLNSINKVKPKSSNNWAGNGSGIIISKSGHIITNHHVIKDAEKIEVEFMLDNELQKLNAEVIQIDKTNDLAVLKIFDRNFDGVNEPPYNFKFRGSDVGTKVYAFGYPMALSIMGKEIKVTDGMISSKSGFDGNITTYQITAPIQGGNSGGPLFDEHANLIGINSSGLKKDIADNVAYSIKTSYVSNLLDVLPKSIELPSSTRLKYLPLTKQIKEISKYVVLIKVK